MKKTYITPLSEHLDILLDKTLMQTTSPYPVNPKDETDDNWSKTRFQPGFDDILDDYSSGKKIKF